MTSLTSVSVGRFKRPLFVLVAALATQATFASPQAGSWNLNPGFGGQWYDEDRYLKTAPLFGLGLEYGLSESFSLELSYWQGESERDRIFLTIDPVDMTFQELRLDALYHVNALSIGSLTPYLAAGLGYGRFSVDDDTIWDDARVNFGPGASLQLGESWRLLGDVRLAHGLGDGDLDVIARLGVSYKLWPRPARVEVAEPAPVERAAPEPAPAPAPVEAKPAPAPVVAAPVMEIVEERMVERFVTHFEVNKADFDTADSSELAELAAFLEQYPEAKVVITGHTDNTGPTALNERLSLERAETVARRLRTEHGISPIRIETRGMGYRQPLATNRTEAGNALNRRAEAEAEVVVEVEVEVR